MIKPLINLLPLLGKRVALPHGDDSHPQINKKFLTEQGFDVVPFATTMDKILENVFTDIILYTDPTYRHMNWPVPTTSVEVFLYKPELTHNTIQSYVYNGSEFDFVQPSSVPFSTRAPAEDDQYFTQQFLNCLPVLQKHQDKFVLIYAGATEQYAAYSRDPQDLRKQVQMYLDRGYKHIVFWCGEETFNPGGFCVLQRVVDGFQDHDDVEFYYATSGLDGPKTYQHYAEKFKFKKLINIIAFTRFDELNKSMMPSISNDMLNALNRPYFKKTRPYKFLNFNRMPRPHRKVFMTLMEKNELIDHGLNSFDNRINFGEPPADDFIRNYIEPLGPDILNAYSKFASRLPLVLNRTPERENPTELDISDVQYYNNSYFSIVSETCYYVKDPYDEENFPGVFFSEKVYKPLLMKHPFILVAFPGSLKYLQQLGYKTFSPWIDESYDAEYDDMKRMHMLIAEIKRLCNLSDSEWCDMQVNLESIVEHNQQHMLADKNLCINPEVLDKICSE